MLGKAMIYATEIAAMIAVAFQPEFAQHTDMMPALPWPAQLGVIGMLGGLLWWQMAKKEPEEAKRRGQELDRMLNIHRETSVGISDDIKQMTSEIKAMRVSTQKLNESIKSVPCLLKEKGG